MPPMMRAVLFGVLHAAVYASELPQYTTCTECASSASGYWCPAEAACYSSYAGCGSSSIGSPSSCPASGSSTGGDTTTTTTTTSTSSSSTSGSSSSTSGSSSSTSGSSSSTSGSSSSTSGSSSSTGSSSGMSTPSPPPASSPSGPISFCDVINQDLPICTCGDSDGGFDAKLTCSLPIGPVQPTGPPVTVPSYISSQPLPALTLGFDMSYDLCSAPMTMQFEGSLQLGFLSDFPSADAQLLNTGIQDAISAATQDDPSFPPLSYDSSTYTLSISKTLQAGAVAWSLSIPFFYVSVASFDAKLELTLTGDMESVTLTAKVDACIDFLGDLADLSAFVTDGDKSLCASQLPNCAAQPGNSDCTAACTDGSSCTCPWVGTAWPCTGTTGYSNDCCIDPLTCADDVIANGAINTARIAADTACGLLDDPDMLAIAGNPPWTIAQKTWHLTDACNDAMTYQTQLVIPTTAGPEPTASTLSSLETYFGQLAHLPAELVVATASSSAPYTYTITLKATSSSKASSHLTAVNGPGGVETASKAATALNTATGSTSFAVAEKPTHSVAPISSGSGGGGGDSGNSPTGGSIAANVIIGIVCAVVIIAAGVFFYLRFVGILKPKSASVKTLAEQEVTLEVTEVPEITDKTTEVGAATANSSKV